MPSPRALLVARKPANRRLLGNLLEGEGLEVVEADDVEPASSKAESETAFDIALVDIGGLTPEIWAVCKTLGDRGTPVVVMTPSRTEEVDQATLKAGVHSVLEKPLQKANLKAIVASLVSDK